MKYVLSLLLLVVLFNASYSQKLPKEYVSSASEAETLYRKRNFKEAIPLFQKAFTFNKGMATVLHRYELASCWAVLNQPDSAFVQLKRITDKGNFAGYSLISKDINFINLHNDSRWPVLLEKIQENADRTGKF
ncbi:hypothetical protein [Pedobacter borealis]|uniref:hypothetical protein n=1 Tax=Pedobacter borealis TaxID=475254 RepID=UPI00049373B9|nr:hypothetical protein [Pedobacter borealis]